MASIQPYQKCIAGKPCFLIFCSSAKENMLLLHGTSVIYFCLMPILCILYVIVPDPSLLRSSLWRRFPCFSCTNSLLDRTLNQVTYDNSDAVPEVYVVVTKVRIRQDRNTSFFCCSNLRCSLSIYPLEGHHQRNDNTQCQHSKPHRDREALNITRCRLCREDLTNSYSSRVSEA